MTTDDSRNLYRGALAAYGLTVGLMLAASVFPDARLWGLNWYGLFGWYARGALVLAGIGVPLVIRFLPGRDRSYDDASPAGRSLYPLLSFLVLTAFGAAFLVFRGRTHFLGDGYQLLSWLKKSLHLKPWEKGTYLVQDGLFGLLGGGNGDALPALQLISYAAGLILLIGTAIVAARLFSSTSRRLLFLLGVGTGGYALLFFGYLESYPLFVASTGLFCLIGLLVARGRAPRWSMLVPLAAAVFFHVFSVVLLPAAIYLLTQRTPLGNRVRSQSPLTRWGLAAGLALVAITVFSWLYSRSYFFRFTIVPLWPDRFMVDGYWMFSGKHLLDYLNQLFVLLPGLLLLTGLFINGRLRARLRQPEGLFLVLVLAPSLGLMFMINPGLGMPRDWDLFAFTGMPLVIMLYYLLLDRESVPGGRAIAVLAISLGLAVLGPRVATQVMPEKGVALFDTYAELDRAKNSSGRYILREYLSEQGRYREAERRRLMDNAVLPEGEWVETARSLIARGEVESAMHLLRRAIESDPSHYMAWANLGAAHALRGNSDSALFCLTVADARMPFNSGIYTNLGGVYFRMENYERAEQIWLEAVRLSPTDYIPRRQLLLLYRQQERAEDYRLLLEETSTGADTPPDILSMAAELRLSDDDFETAARLLGRALAVGLDTAYVCSLQTRYPQLEVVICED